MRLLPLKLSLPWDYVKNVLKRRDAIIHGLKTYRSQKRCLPPPLLMIPEKHYLITVYELQPPLTDKGTAEPEKNDQGERGEIPLAAPAGRGITDKSTVEPERSYRDKRGDIQLVQVFEKDKIKGRMEPERTTLEPLPAGTVVEASGQPRLSCGGMQRSVVGGCRHADGSLEQGREHLSSSHCRVKPDDQTSQFHASCKIVFLPVS